MLNVSTSVPSANVWQPILAGEDCEPVDYMSLLRDAKGSGKDKVVDPKLEFARGKTILLVGDSIDRE